MTIAITATITPFAEAERRFHLSRTEDEMFFSEWQATFPDLSIAEKTSLDELRRRFPYQQNRQPSPWPAQK